LLARAVAGLIQKSPVLLRHAAVIFLYPRLQLGKEFFSHRLVRVHHGGKIGVLFFQIGKYRRIIDLGIALVFEPIIGVNQGDAVAAAAVGDAFGNRRHYFDHGFALSLGGQQRRGDKAEGQCSGGRCEQAATVCGHGNPRGDDV
jgi:hypothetical protein